MGSKISEIRYSCNGRVVTFEKPLVMAVVNVTPDSFYDGGKFLTTEDVVRDAGEKLKQGADILDIGAASSRPGAPEISEGEEWQRLKAPLKAILNAYPDALVSVDTYRARIAESAAAEGASMINDISGGELDSRMEETVLKLNLPYIMMHMPGTPRTMATQPEYEDVVETVFTDLTRRAASLKNKGFDKIILDPGFGFGKSLENNYELLKHLHRFCGAGFPVLAGISRKSMINKVLGTNPVTALNGTTVLNTIALLNGASILRVHDVKEARQAIKLVDFYRMAGDHNTVEK
jgi:dihydropteroate synthase